MHKLAVITSTRAEYGLLSPLIKQMNRYNDIDVRVVATGMHLSSSFGNTIDEIEQDGITVDEKIEILFDGDTSDAMSKTMGIAFIEFANYFKRKEPNAILVLGDRYEIFAVCMCAMIYRIPIIHLCGGEVTEGAIDDVIRHSITKMSSLHFTIAEEYRKRVIQMGENPKNVYNFGSLGNENIVNLKLLNKTELETAIAFDLSKPYSVVTFHPETLNRQSCSEQFAILQEALLRFDNMNYIITKSNADTGGREINRLIDAFASENTKRVYACESLGKIKYLSAVKYCEMVIGNSSSGIVEVPTFRIPTINIGNRQKGRIEAESVISCNVCEREIYNAMMKAMSTDFRKKIQKTALPFYKENTSNNISKVIHDYLLNGKLSSSKKFFDINF